MTQAAKLYVNQIPRIIQNGYQAIPVTTNGGIPLVEKYTTKIFTKNDADEWADKFQSSHIAVVCGVNDVYALDFDIDDVEMADILMRKIKTKYPNILVRTCNPGRFACLFRAKESLLEYSEAHSETFTVQGNTAQIELIGNRAFMLWGKHRKTRKTYRWGNNRNPYKTSVLDIAELNKVNIEKIFDFFKHGMQQKYKLKDVRNFTDREMLHEEDGDSADDLGFSEDQKYPHFADSKVQRYLNHFSGDDRPIWLKMGMALHVQYRGSDEGLEVWDAWSAQFEGYAGSNDVQTQWNSFKKSKGKMVTFRTFATWYNKQTQGRALQDQDVATPETVEDFEERFVLIEKGSRVADLSMPPEEQLLKISEWECSMSNVVAAIPVGDKVKEIEVYKLWKKSRSRITCYNTTYYPSTERILRNTSRGSKSQYCNIYSPPFVNQTKDRDLIPLFLDHLAYMFPNEGDTEWMVNWLAQLVQSPHERFRVAPLSISTFHGTGRGWLGNVMQNLVGISNSSTLKEIGEIVRSGAKTGFINNTTLCLVNETYVKQAERYQIDNRLRNLLGDSFQHVDVKYGEEASKTIYTRFFFQSNHMDAMVLDEKDERIEVFMNNSPPREKEYYKKMYGLIGKGETEFMDQLYCYLCNDVVVDESMLQASRKTPAREALIKAGKSPTGVGFLEFKQLVGDGLFTDHMLKEFMAEYQVLHGTDSSTINPKELNFLINKEIKTKQMVKTKNKGSVKVCSFAHNNMDDVVKSINQSKEKIKLYFKSINDNGE